MERLLEYNRKDLRNWAGEELAAKFFETRSKYPAPYNNLDYWINNGTPEELSTYMNNYKSNNQKRKEVVVEGAEKIYDDGRWTVVLCKTYPAMALYGKGTRWCIAGNYPGHEGRGQEYFDSYKQSRYTNYYVYIDKEAPEGNNKWCVCPLKSNPLDECDIWNAPDRTVPCIPNAPTLPNMPPVSNIVILDNVLLKLKQADDNSAIFNVPEGVEAIGRKAFVDLRNLDEVKIPNSVKAIGSGAFASSSIKTAVIPDSVTQIGTALFGLCEILKTVSLGTGITSINKNMFAFCSGLDSVIVNGIIENIGQTPFDGVNKNCTFYVRNPYRNRKLVDYLNDQGFTVVDASTSEVI